MGAPRIIAHRGASGYRPENTLMAFEYAADLGATWVEFDAMLSADNVAVIHHDETLRRITGDPRGIGETPVAEITALDAGSWLDPDFHEARIPTLMETMELLANCDMGANVEIKPCKGKDNETARAVMTEIVEYWPDNLPPPVISSFSETALEEARETAPDFEYALLLEGLPSDWAEKAERLGCKAIHIDWQSCDAAFVQKANRNGIAVRCYTVNDPSVGQRLIAFGVESIITDYPDRFQFLK